MRKAIIYSIATSLYLATPLPCRTLCRQPSMRDGICDLFDIIIDIATALKARSNEWNY